MRAKELYAVSALVLVLGLTVAGVIYLTAPEEGQSAAMSEIYGSKPYVRELQRFGGKASVLFDEFQRWFAGLWHGKKLGVTIAWITVASTLVLVVVARGRK